MTAQEAIDRAHAKALRGIAVAEAEKDPTIQVLALVLTLVQVTTMLGEHVSSAAVGQ